MVSPNYWLLPEARRVVAKLQKLCTAFSSNCRIKKLRYRVMVPVVLFMGGSLRSRWDVERRRRVPECCLKRLLECMQSQYACSTL